MATNYRESRVQLFFIVARKKVIRLRSFSKFFRNAEVRVISRLFFSNQPTHFGSSAISSEKIGDHQVTCFFRLRDADFQWRFVKKGRKNDHPPIEFSTTPRDSRLPHDGPEWSRSEIRRRLPKIFTFKFLICSENVGQLGSLNGYKFHLRCLGDR